MDGEEKRWDGERQRKCEPEPGKPTRVVWLWPFGGGGGGSGWKMEAEKRDVWEAKERKKRSQAEKGKASKGKVSASVI